MSSPTSTLLLAIQEYIEQPRPQYGFLFNCTSDFSSLWKLYSYFPDCLVINPQKAIHPKRLMSFFMLMDLIKSYLAVKTQLSNRIILSTRLFSPLENE